MEDEADVLALLHRAHVQMLAHDAVLAVEAVDELAKVRGEEHGAPLVVEQLFDDRRCYGRSLVGTRAAAHLVEDDERVRRAHAEDEGRRAHLGRKRRQVLRRIVLVREQAQDGIGDGQRSARRRDEAPDACKHSDECDLTQEGALARHVGACDQAHPLARTQVDVVGHKRSSASHEDGRRARSRDVDTVQDRVPCAADVERVAKRRSDVVVGDRDDRETHHHVEQRERLGHLHSSHFARSESVDANSDDGDATRVKLTLYRDATLPMISSMSSSMMVSDMVKTSFIDSTSRALSFFWRSKRSMFCQCPRSVRDGVDPVVSTHEGQCQHGDGVARLCRGDVGETLRKAFDAAPLALCLELCRDRHCQLAILIVTQPTQPLLAY
ncbi:hypothetical protein L1887_49692 [Cichorium endivia]|nr:hypothetical protein L1887_49692 [Cichorium endivia]